MDIMRERIDTLGVAEPEIQRSGDDQIDVALPDVKNADQAQQQVGTVAQLLFYDWEKSVLGKDGKPHPLDPNVTGGSSAGQPGAGTMTLLRRGKTASKFKPTNEPDDTHQRALLRRRRQDQDRPLRARRRPRRDLRESCANAAKSPTQRRQGPARLRHRPGRGHDADKNAQALAQDPYYILKDDPKLRGTDIKNPEQNIDNGAGGTGQPTVTFDFTSSGRKKWQNVTREIAQRGEDQLLPGQDSAGVANHFAIVLDNKLISVPFIDPRENPDGIDGSNGSEIRGGFTIRSAQRLANLLKTGALPIKLELISQSQVSATLGQQALHQGLIAGIVGFAIVALFLLVFYRVLGIIAVGALFIYAIYFFALIKLIPITMTLPGIAGLILTIGVAADANIVIFERVKEEIRAAARSSAGIVQGYRKGIAAIIDANVVTFMVAFILFILATAGVKGFAFTLGIGTLTSLFTAVLATQAVLGTMQRSRAARSPSALGAGEKQAPLDAGLHGRVEVVLLDVGRDPAHRRAGHRRQGPELRHRLPVGHARQGRLRAAAERERRRRRPARRGLPRPRGPEGQGGQGAQGQRDPDLAGRERRRHRQGQPLLTQKFGAPKAYQSNSRSARRSARRWPRARSSRSSRR